MGNFIENDKELLNEPEDLEDLIRSNGFGSKFSKEPDPDPVNWTLTWSICWMLLSARLRLNRFRRENSTLKIGPSSVIQGVGFPKIYPFYPKNILDDRTGCPYGNGDLQLLSKRSQYT